ncbi:alpha/beta fold hydrolase [Nocardia abscessus]|uniref:Alpha/beta fold hydrolase n=1 Tax=Nocardia abscessus TaxID=120957 RepID=A0ABS0CG29_9NOCA|nr:alpha/beta fold hydrolase [Nocardia abscessus]MBF6228815.1 alpha/beta fold hydrolase [Nocardia abscessus]
MKYFVDRDETRRLDGPTRGELRGEFLRCGDGITHYELSGPAAAETVVFAGGLTVPLFYWDELAAELRRRGFRTLTYSAYGRGYSDRVQARYDEALFVRQLTDLTERLELSERFHLVGTSMGALVAMAFAEQHVDRVATLTLAGPAGLQPAPAAARLLRHEFLGTVLAKSLGSRMLDRHLSHNVRDPQRSAALTAMVRECYQFEGSIYALAATIAHFPLGGRQDLYRRTGHLPVPRMLLWGDQDQVTPITNYDEVCALLAPTVSHIFSPCGHMVPYEEPARMGSRFTAFVDAAKEGTHR